MHLEIPIPAPQNMDGSDPNSEAMSFLRELHDALMPLEKYKLVDGSEAVYVCIRDHAEGCCFIGDNRFGRGGHDPSPNDPLRGWWVLAFTLRRDPHDDIPDSVSLYSGDFAGQATMVLEVFRQVITHLEQYATVPQVPEKLRQALLILKD